VIIAQLEVDIMARVLVKSVKFRWKHKAEKLSLFCLIKIWHKYHYFSVWSERWRCTYLQTFLINGPILGNCHILVQCWIKMTFTLYKFETAPCLSIFQSGCNHSSFLGKHFKVNLLTGDCTEQVMMAQCVVPAAGSWSAHARG
jgi:hypothetical protein